MGEGCGEVRKLGFLVYVIDRMVLLFNEIR